jgi:predicted GIY-YIG superfamily endonuclease
MVECADGSYYVGSTWHIEQRLWEHNSDDRGALYTRRRRPVRLVWSAEFDSVADAFWLEKQVQGWSRDKREALIAGDWAALPDLSKRGRLTTYSARRTE